MKKTASTEEHDAGESDVGAYQVEFPNYELKRTTLT